jgi:ribosomal protein L21E
MANNVKAKQATKKYKSKLKKLGLCANCGQLEAAEGKFKCETCLQINRIYTQKKREYAISNDLCLACKKVAQGIHISYCEVCWFKNAARANGFSTEQWSDLKFLLEKQNYSCAYTGQRLYIGVNASVDHKNPKKRFPSEVANLENIAWVALEVNIMKRDRTEDEFISLCKEVVEYCG